MTSKSGKIKVVFSFVIAAMLLSASVLAVITSYADWQDGTFSKTIYKTDTALFDVKVFSTHPDLYYSIYMANPSGATVKTWANDVLENDGSAALTGLSIGRADLTIGGIYTIYITSRDDEYSGQTTLTLNVLNRAPVIEAINAPASINAGDKLSVSFTASDHDNDAAITYRIYRNNALIASTNSNEWQTSASDAGTYTYRFEVTDGEDTDSETRTIVVGSAAVTTAEEVSYPETLKLGRDIEISKIYNYLKIRSNKGEVLNNFELKVTYLDLNAVEEYNFDMGRGDVVYRQLMTELPENKTYIAKIQVSAEGMEDSGYLLIRK